MQWKLGVIDNQAIDLLEFFIQGDLMFEPLFLHFSYINSQHRIHITFLKILAIVAKTGKRTRTL